MLERASVAVCVACLAVATTGPLAQALGAPSPAGVPSAPVANSDAVTNDAGLRSAAIERAARALREEADLAARRKKHTLTWTSDAPDKPEPLDASWLDWLRMLARFLSEASRLLVWGLALVAVAVLLVSLRHAIRLRTFARRATKAPAVSHVRDLDVRPASLPDDIGATAWILWQAGRVPEALSLLYRGALSRLIHRHGVPIAESTTEGESLDLASGRIEPTVLRYLTRVVRAREASIYGGRTLSAEMGEALCTGFASQLDAAVPTTVSGMAP